MTTPKADESADAPPYLEKHVRRAIELAHRQAP
jgi:hypothetical protein